MINSNDKFLETEPSRPQIYYKSTRPGISRLGGSISRLQKSISRLGILLSRLTETNRELGSFRTKD